MRRTILAAAITVAALPVSAEDRAAQEFIVRWINDLRAAPRVSCECRIQRINHVFEARQEGRGTYLQDSPNRWTLIVTPVGDGPVSALETANGPYNGRGILRPYTVISTPAGLWVGWGEPLAFEEYLWPAVSAAEAENASPQKNRPAWGAWLQRAMIEASSRPCLMPLFWIENSTHMDARLIEQADGGIWLSFERRQGQHSLELLRRVDAVFRRDANLPYAIRIVDNSGSFESRYYFDRVRLGRDAEIPVDAFDVPTNIRRIVDPETETITVLTFPAGKSEYAVHGEFKPGHQAASVLLPGFAVDVTACFAAGKGEP
jgi:hypothetical protein